MFNEGARKAGWRKVRELLFKWQTPRRALVTYIEFVVPIINNQ